MDVSWKSMANTDVMEQRLMDLRRLIVRTNKLMKLIIKEVHETVDARKPYVQDVQTKPLIYVAWRMKLYEWQNKEKRWYKRSVVLPCPHYDIRELIEKAINVFQEMNTKDISETNLLIYATYANIIIAQFPRVNHNCNVDFITFRFSNNFPLKDVTTSIHRASDVYCLKGSFAMIHS